MDMALGATRVYLRQIRLTNIKGFRNLVLNFEPHGRERGGWYAILGENGTGKSTLLRAMALALAGRERAAVLLPNAEGWVSDGQLEGSCSAQIELPSQPSQRVPVEYGINSLPMEDEDYGFVSSPRVLFRKLSSVMARELYSRGGGFSAAGYGPFRSLAEQSSVRTTSGRGEDPLASLFYPAPLTECEEWLQRLDYMRKSRADDLTETLFKAVLGVVNQLLPGPFQIVDVRPDGVVFSGPGAQLSLAGLSDGYRTMFGLAVDLVRRCAESITGLSVRGFRQDDRGRWSVLYPGVVLIDEVEAHLHPRWQREVGFYLKRAFPNIQFIVATHSPFVAQAATHDGIFILNRRGPGGTISLDDTLDSLRGWRAEQILSSPAFGLETTRDLETEELMRRHEELRARQHSGLDLSEAEQQELTGLTARLVHVLPRPGRTVGEKTP